MKTPKCCRNCKQFDSDYNEYSGITAYYCILNIFLPTKKQTCKRQQPYNKEVEHERACCNSPGEDKCEQCQEIGSANPCNH